MLDFLGIGAQKAGTTWIFRQLSRHPKLALPPEKELHFWDMHHARGVEWYQQQFPDRSDGVLQGEITPAYAFLPIETIQKIYALFPNLRIFYSVRNPVDRAWSSALMALKRAEMSVEEASDQWFIDHFSSAGSQARGDYERCMRNWLLVYPMEQFLLLQFDDIMNDPLGLLHRLCRYLGVDPDFYGEDLLAELKHKVNKGASHPIRPTLKAYLEAMYAGRTAAFQEYCSRLGL